MKLKKLLSIHCKLFLLLNFAITLFLTGCQTTKKELDYKDYLTNKEEKKLIGIARGYVLKKMKGKLTKYEISFIKKIEPLVKVRYTDHKYGKAQIVWDPSLKVNLFNIPIEQKINLTKLRKNNKKKQRAFYILLSGKLLDDTLGMQLKTFNKSKVRYYDDRRKIPNPNDMSNPELMKSYAPLIYDTKEELETAVKVFDQLSKAEKRKKSKPKN